MIQQKFASNDVEKCLSFDFLDGRQILIDEMVGATDENEPFSSASATEVHKFSS
jgi:hypothetical protein